MTEEQIIKAAEHFSRTGEIQDSLIPFFKQSGRWVGDPHNWSKSTYRMVSSAMHQAFLPEKRRTALNANGDPVLLTSFVWKKRRDIELTWYEVRGSINIRSLEVVSAPNLRAVGGYIYSFTDSVVRLPNLLWVGGDCDFQGTLQLHATELTEVGGSLLVNECDLPNLRSVGNRLSGYWAGDLHLPKLRHVGGSMEIEGALRVIAPSLEWVCYDLNLSYFTTVFCANRLVEVGGSMDARSARIFRAAALRSIGDTLNTQAAHDFYRPQFEELALWAAHPDAERHWEMREAVRKSMRDLPQLWI